MKFPGTTINVHGVASIPFADPDPEIAAAVIKCGFQVARWRKKRNSTGIPWQSFK